MPVIDRKFENQKEYIACSKGCAHCCKTTGMPFSDVEFEYLMEGYNSLDEQKKSTVKENVKKIVNSDKNEPCPFLIDNVCSVYKYRGLICRTFGLLLISDEGDYNVPFCVHEGLNYSKIFDESTQQLSPDKVRELGYKNDPIYCTLSRPRMFSLSIAKDLDIIPKESKPLSDWVKDNCEIFK